MDYQKKIEELTKEYDKNNKLMSDHRNKINEILQRQEQIKGKYELLNEMQQKERESKKKKRK